MRRRQSSDVNICIQVEEVAVYFVTFVKSIEVLLDASQISIGDRGLLSRLTYYHANRSHVLRIAEIQILMDNIDARFLVRQLYSFPKCRRNLSYRVKISILLDTNSEQS